MKFSVLGPEGKVQAQLDAVDIKDACRQWAQQTSNEATVEAIVRKAKLFPVGQEHQAARLEPNVLAPAGFEQEALRKSDELFSQDVHYQSEASLPDPRMPDPRMVDTGGRG